MGVPTGASPSRSPSPPFAVLVRSHTVEVIVSLIKRDCHLNMPHTHQTPDHAQPQILLKILYWTWPRRGSHAAAPHLLTHSLARGHARCCAARRLRYSYTVRCMTHRTPFSLSAARAETEHETTETTHRHTRKGVARSTGCANRETLDHLTLKAVMRASGSPLLATDLLSRDRDQSG